MTLRWPSKDPQEVLDFQIDWSARLAGDIISSSSWEVPAGLTRGSETLDTTHTILWLSGGTADVSYDIVNRVTTSGGRTMDQTVSLRVKSK